MRVAYDLRYAADHFTGIGTHAYELLRSCLDAEDSTEFVVLWNPAARAVRYDVSTFRAHPRVTWVERDWWPLSPVDPLRISAWLRWITPDAYLSPFYVMPPVAGCASVLTLHDVSPLELSGTLSRTSQFLFNLALRGTRRAHAVLTSSRCSRDAIVKVADLGHDRVHVVPLGVPGACRTPHRRPSGLPEGDFALVVGENRPRKNLQVLARAWAQLHQDAALSLVSAGRVHSHHPSLERLVADTPAAAHVSSLGWTPAPELGWLYAHASMLLMPSRYEGFGFPLVEGFAAGIPVVVADTPVFREVGADAVMYVPPDDADAWADAVDRVRRDVRLRATLTARGRARAAELTYRRTAAATLSVVRRAAARA